MTSLRYYLSLTIFSALIAALFLASLSIGAYRFYTPFDVIRLTLGGGDSIDSTIVKLRFWRSIAAVCVGIGLAVSGLVIQRLLGNPMVDPYILGISPGAALGFLTAVHLGLGLPFWYLTAFMGGLLSYVMVVLIASMVGLTSLALIVVGVAISYAFHGLLIILLALLSPREVPAIVWLFGSVAYITKNESQVLVIIVLAGLLVLFLNRKALTALLLGEEVSSALGVNVTLLRLILTAIVALIVSITVATSGPIGFIGLTAPWIARVLVGADFRRLLPLTIVIGASLGLGSDIMVKVLGGGRELPLTAITALLGAPTLLYLSVRGRSVGRL